MKKRVKKLWLEALRSGKYEQGQQKLKNKDGQYCCLGVLCEVYSASHPDAKFVDGYWAPYFAVPGTDGNEYLPPKPVAEWAGIDEDDMNMLATHNDRNIIFPDEGPRVLPSHSFDEIADLIENYL